MFKLRRLKLTIRLNIIVALTIMIVVALMGYVDNRMEVRETILTTIHNSGALADVIREDISRFMSERNMSGIQERISSVRESNNHINSISLVGANGVIAASSDPDSIGLELSATGPGCIACHRSSPPLHDIPGAELGNLVRRSASENYIRIVSPVYNSPSCYEAACHVHTATQKVLGLLVADFDFTPTLVAMRRRSFQTFGFAIAAVLLVTGVIAAFIWQYVDRPLGSLLEGMKHIEEGNLGQRIRLPYKDEVGQLAGKYNSMADSLFNHEKDLRETRDYLLAIVENSTDFIITIDPHDMIRTFNHGAEHILGFSRDEMIGRHWNDLFFSSADLLDFKEMLRKNLRVVNYETRFARKDGESVNVLATKSLLKDPEGNVIGKILIGVDLTEYKKMQAKLIRSERHAAIGAAMTQIMHGAKNILNAFKGGQYMVNLGLKKNDTKILREGWEVVETGVKRLAEITSDLLDFSRAGQLDLAPGSINALAKEVIWTYRNTDEKKDVKIYSEFEDDIPDTMFDSKAMHSALMNLISNAVDACRWKEYDQGETPEVTVRTFFDHDSFINVEVKDNGSGIPEKIMKDIFEPFYSTKFSGGNGLGLPITKKVAKQHGGNLEVFSEEGKGSTFMIRLPVKRSGVGGDAKKRDATSKGIVLEMIKGTEKKSEKETELS